MSALTDHKKSRHTGGKRKRYMEEQLEKKRKTTQKRTQKEEKGNYKAG